MRKKFLVRYSRAKCTLGDSRLALVIWSAPFSVGKYPKVMAGRPASRLAINANTVRNAAFSEPTSMSCVTVLDSNIAFPSSHDNLTPVVIIPCDREGSIPAAPVVFRRCGAIIVNQISFALAMLTNDGRFGP
eukprot:3508502-Pyramimonas_sp.AAC.1